MPNKSLNIYSEPGLSLGSDNHLRPPPQDMHEKVWFWKKCFLDLAIFWSLHIYNHGLVKLTHLRASTETFQYFTGMLQAWWLSEEVWCWHMFLPIYRVLNIAIFQPLKIFSNVYYSLFQYWVDLLQTYWSCAWRRKFSARFVKSAPLRVFWVFLMFFFSILLYTHYRRLSLISLMLKIFVYTMIGFWT